MWNVAVDSEVSHEELLAYDQRLLLDTGFIFKFDVNYLQYSGGAMKALVAIVVMFSLFGCAEVGAVLNGEVILDANRVESGIKDGIKDQSGIDVSVECPDPLSAEVGETRTCLVRYSGFTEMVDITVQNTDGYFIWEVRQ